MLGLLHDGKAAEASVDGEPIDAHASRACTVPGTAELSEVDIRGLAPGTEIIIDTVHSKYRLVVMDGPVGRARMQGGRLFLEPTEVLIIGTRREDHELMAGMLRVGLGFDFVAWHQRGRTSLVESIVVRAPAAMRG